MSVLPFELPTQPVETLPDRLPAPAGRLAPERVYESPLATVWHGDARDVLRVMATESVDLVVTDPPYNVAWESRRRAESFGQLVGDGDDEESRAMVDEVLTGCVRVVGQHRHLYAFYPSDPLAGLKVSDTTSLIWDKGSMGSGDMTAAWGPSHEFIWFAASKFRHAGKAGKPALPVRMRKETVLRHQRPTGKQVRHPSEKPVTLMRELIESSSKQGETIFDPFAGTGSTGVAALLTGRRVILVEKDPRWVELTAQRVEATEKAIASLGRL